MVWYPSTDRSLGFHPADDDKGRLYGDPPASIRHEPHCLGGIRGKYPMGNANELGE